MNIADLIRTIRLHQAKHYGAYPERLKVSQSDMEGLEAEFNTQRLVFPVDTKAPYYTGMKIMGVPVIVESMESFG